MESASPDIGELNTADLQSSESKTSKGSAFHATLTQIQGKPLSPDNINTYASDALADLIKLTDSVVGDYAKEQPSDSAYGKELEDKAFEHFGLGNLGDILNYVASKELELERIDKLIKGAENVGTILVPPNGDMPQIQEGDGSFGKKSVISRTKTLLFILSNDFDLDLNDPEQVSLKTGILSDTMMRKLSYFMINVPSLNRTILSCDEEGNVTYIFDNDILNAKGISLENLVSLTKENIKELLQANPNLGRRIIYTNNFVPRMINLMTDLDNNNDASNGGAGLYLYPKAPEGILSVKNIAYDLGVDHGTVVKSIAKLGDSLGETTQYRFGAVTTTGYTSEQQEMIRQELDRKGLFSEKAPEGVKPIIGIAREFGVAHNAISAIIDALGETLGETTTYRFGNKLTAGYSSEQQEMIRQELEKRGLFLDQAPEGVLSVYSLSKRLGVGEKSINKAIEELGESLEETTQYRFGTRARITGYTQEQQEMIKQALKEKGLFMEQAPEGVKPIAGIAKEFGVAHDVIKRTVNNLEEALGETATYRFGNTLTAGYNSDQQEIIRQELEKRGLLSEIAPEGILSAGVLAKRLNVDYSTLMKTVEELGDSLGETTQYRFGSAATTGYATAQQEMIRQELEKKGLLSEIAPERILSLHGLSRKLHIHKPTLKKLIEELGDSLGETQTYKFGGYRPAIGYTEEQQEIIKQELERRRGARGSP